MAEARPRPNHLYEDPEPPLQFEKVLRFQQRLFYDMSASLAVLGGYVGDRLGLFGALAGQGPTSPTELAGRQKLCPELVVEWLQTMAAAGYIEHDSDDDRYRLAPEHAVSLANHGGPMCFAGGLQQVGGFAAQLPALLDAFRNGGGVPQATYTSDLREGMERLSSTWIDNELVEHWLAALPVCNRLKAGATVADVGCGAGRALISMAKAFPTSRFVGYDSFKTAIDEAKRNAVSAGVAERISFDVRDAAKGIPAEYDLITAFDSLHDMVDPVLGLAALGRGLRNDGTLLVLELGVDLDEQGPIGTILHATKLFYNLPVALASGGTAPGNASYPEQRMKSLCRRAGLALERTLPVRNPMHKLYVLRAES
jgi:ubiquinone/menaquinone biosynthesis C-methylase UbiE